VKFKEISEVLASNLQNFAIRPRNIKGWICLFQFLPDNYFYEVHSNSRSEALSITDLSKGFN
jgi:hypothetical protein